MQHAPSPHPLYVGDGSKGTARSLQFGTNDDRSCQSEVEYNENLRYGLLLKQFPKKGNCKKQ